VTWLRLINIYILSIILTTRKLKLMKPICMDLIFSASQIKEMVILVDFSAIFLESPLSIFGMPFQCCSVLSRDPVDLVLHCLSQTKHYIHIHTYITWPLPQRDFSGPMETNNEPMNITWLRIPTGRRQTSWLFTNVVPYRYHNDFCMLILPFTVHHLVWL